MDREEESAFLSLQFENIVTSDSFNNFDSDFWPI
jgi:hypothetical protein